MDAIKKHLLALLIISILIFLGFNLILDNRVNDKLNVNKPRGVSYITHVVVKTKDKAKVTISSNTALDTLRENVARELSTVKYYIPPKVIFAVSMRGSGSDFFAKMLNSIPATFYHHEPLSHFGIQDLNLKNNASHLALFELYQLALCDFFALGEYLHYARLTKEIVERNTRLKAVCDNGHPKHPAFCFQKDFLSKACGLHPYQLINVVRLRLPQVANILMDEELASRLQMVVLVRDPRAIMNFRWKNLNWCNVPFCADSHKLCSDLQTDYSMAQALRKTNPDTIYYLRYEDLMHSPKHVIKKLFKFLRLPGADNVLKYLISNSNMKVNNSQATLQDSETELGLWKKEMSFKDVKTVQDACRSIMKTLGYKIFENPAFMKENSVLPFVFSTPK